MARYFKRGQWVRRSVAMPAEWWASVERAAEKNGRSIDGEARRLIWEALESRPDESTKPAHVNQSIARRVR
jgi:hypothetical protein